MLAAAAALGVTRPRAMVAQQRRARLFVIGIGITRARARAALDEHLVAAFDELVGSGGQQRHPVFVVFDFFRDADNHKLKTKH